MLSELREWTMLLFEAYICWILTMEYFYDAAKDAKKSRRTKTIKKAVTAPDGTTTTTEDIETIESKGDKNA